MLPIWSALVLTVHTCEILHQFLEFLRFIHCLVNKAEYESKTEGKEFLKICLSNSELHIINRLMSIPATMAFSAVFIVGILQYRSIYMIPHLVFLGFHETHDSAMLFFKEHKTTENLVWSCLFILIYVVIWTVSFVEYKKTVSVEFDLVERIVDAQRRHYSISDTLQIRPKTKRPEIGEN